MERDERTDPEGTGGEAADPAGGAGRRAPDAGRTVGRRLPMVGDEDRVRTLERRIRLLAEHVPDMIYRYQYRPEPGFDYVSPACTELTGYTPEDHYADPRIMLKVVHPDDRQRMLAAMRAPEEDAGAFPLRWVRRDGSVVWTEQRHRLERDEDGTVRAIEGVVRDVTEHVRFRQQLEYEALHDPVTGMANLRRFTGALGAALGANGPARHLAVLVVAIDRFPAVADMVGRATAQSLLRACGDRLVAAMGSAPGSPSTEGLVAHGTAAEQFLVLCPLLTGADAVEMGGRLRAAFVEPLSLDGREVYLSVTVGGRLVTPGEVQEPERLLLDADEARRAARSRSSRSVVRWFDPALHARSTERVAMENDLRRALRTGSIEVVYQPQVDLRTGALLGLEALARWDRPGHGPVPPATFVAAAEESGLTPTSATTC